MPTPSGFVPVDELRKVIAARLSEMSLRSLAREVGMSPSGLQKFVDGAAPYHPTRQKLERWYVGEAAEERAGMTPGVAQAALGVLLRDLAPSRRREAVRELVRAVRATYDAEPGPYPGWLEELIQDVGLDGGG